MAEGQNIFSHFFVCLCSSQSYCLCIFSSCQLKDNYVVFSDIMTLTFRLETTELDTA